jgi:hypothetical protein
MKDFVAYHSVKLWGEYAPADRLHFYSGKGKSFLRTSIGENVWVIVGKPGKYRSSFFLAGVYSPETIRKRKHRGFDILGFGKPFKPLIELSNLPWFAKLLKEQGGFRFGFNQVQNKLVLDKLRELLERSKDKSRIDYSIPDIDEPEIAALEGAARMALVRHRKREQSLRDAKISEARKFGNDSLKCEVPGCGFDFKAVYGELGRDYAQVHHLKPLGKRTTPSETILSDLAIVCANCHAMIHRGGKCRPLQNLIP